MTADKLEELGLIVSEPSQILRNRLKDSLPPYVSLGNPFDLLAYGSAENFFLTCQAIAPEYDALITIFVPTSFMDSTLIAKAIGEAKKKIKKPILASFMAGRLVKKGIEELKSCGIPNYEIGERCAKVIQKIALHTFKNLKVSQNNK